MSARRIRSINRSIARVNGTIEHPDGPRRFLVENAELEPAGSGHIRIVVAKAPQLLKLPESAGCMLLDERPDRPFPARLTGSFWTRDKTTAGNKGGRTNTLCSVNREQHFVRCS